MKLFFNKKNSYFFCRNFRNIWVVKFVSIFVGKRFNREVSIGGFFRFCFFVYYRVFGSLLCFFIFCVFMLLVRTFGVVVMVFIVDGRNV